MSLAALALTIALPAATAATSVAVSLAVVPLGGESEQPPLALAQQLAAALEQRGRVPLAQPVVAQRLREFTGPNEQSLETVRAQVESARSAYAAFDLAQSARLLEQAVHSLEIDTGPTPEKLELLQQVRLQLADRLLALAGGGETGRAETDGGKRALVQLEAALRADPLLAPPAGVYPPRMRQLLELARHDVRTAGAGSLTIRSTPAGATVRIEGRVLGATPLVLDRSIPFGRYRVWLELAGRRSRTRSIEVGSRAVTLDVDLGFEGAIDATTGGLRAVGPALLTDSELIETGHVLDVEQLVATGYAEYEGSHWVYAALYDVAAGTALRRGAVRVTGHDGVDEPTMLAALADFLVTSGATPSAIATAPVPIRQRIRVALPTQPLPASVPPLASTAPESGPGWLVPTALISGAIVAAALATGTVALFYVLASAPTAPERSLHIEVRQ